ncbi:hypothetical protein [Falsiroseomonas bella]|uniref:hypothetical protein n=1 Tax=Falsiroseomonas bella TaxID=2184016 RepID=UPI0011B470ED|nr:hypothetical protein [Falsiroseomonas bella]
MTYREDVFLEVLQPPWFQRAREVAMLADGDLYGALSKVLRCCCRVEGIEDPSAHAAAFAYSAVPENGGYYAEFWTEWDIASRVWIPLKTDWLPFHTRHAMPFLQAHASLAMVNHLKRTERRASSVASTSVTADGLPPWLGAAHSRRQSAHASADSEAR